MGAKKEILHQLIELSHWLGDECRGFAILGEGNTSARAGEDTFFIKASGARLGTVTTDGIVEVNLPKVLMMLDGTSLTDEQIKECLRDASTDKSIKLIPSMETLFHAYLLSIPGVRFIGHTHPVSVNSILCSKDWREMISGRIFPDEITCCGLVPAYLEYKDPGIPLGKEIRRTVEDYTSENRVRPKAILVQNHGLIAIGSSASEVKSITAMWDKAAKILAGTMQFGGPNYLSAEHVNRIHVRPDEVQRQELIEGM